MVACTTRASTCLQGVTSAATIYQQDKRSLQFCQYYYPASSLSFPLLKCPRVYALFLSFSSHIPISHTSCSISFLFASLTLLGGGRTTLAIFYGRVSHLYYFKTMLVQQYRLPSHIIKLARYCKTIITEICIIKRKIHNNY